VEGATFAGELRETVVGFTIYYHPEGASDPIRRGLANIVRSRTPNVKVLYWRSAPVTMLPTEPLTASEATTLCVAAHCPRVAPGSPLQIEYRDSRSGIARKSKDTAKGRTDKPDNDL
jgi:hypothetical protein